MFAVIDTETTGLNPHENRIIEIAILVYEHGKIANEFSSLINPSVEIPAMITCFTGISNEMVQNSPTFGQIAGQVDELTANRVLVCHNAPFDYGFLKCEFERTGSAFARKRVCTVQLSRKLIPGLPSYSLGNLCQSLDIDITDRHRAMGDARATLKLFRLLRSLDSNGTIDSHIHRGA